MVSSVSEAGSSARIGLSTPYSHTKNRLRGTPPVYQLPCSWNLPTLPMPAPDDIGTIAAGAGWFMPASASCHSADDEQPSVPTLPFDQGWFAIHVSVS